MTSFQQDPMIRINSQATDLALICPYIVTKSCHSHTFVTPWINLDYNLGFKRETFFFPLPLSKGFNGCFHGLIVFSRIHIQKTWSSILKGAKSVIILAPKYLPQYNENSFMFNLSEPCWKTISFYLKPCIFLGSKYCILILVINAKMC